MPQEGGDQIHHQWFSILQLGFDLKRGGRRRHREGVGEGVEDQLDGNESELGPKLAIQRGFGWTITLLSC